MKTLKILSSLLIVSLGCALVSCGDDDLDTNQDLEQENGNYFVCGSVFSDDILNLFDISQFVVVDGDTVAKTVCVAENAANPMIYEDSVHCSTFRTYAYTSSRPVEFGVEARLKSTISENDIPASVDFVYYSNFGQIEAEPNESTWATLIYKSNLSTMLGFNIKDVAAENNTSVMTYMKMQAANIETYRTFY
ncbi:MAG: hypothetical protein K6E54_11290 [Bacteroidaceae bacterium]|nr:hypothetical protein [Bacteroidaceae bacterium]